MLTAGIVGASGYTGLELVRLVIEHPALTLSHIISRTYAGQSLGNVFPQFSGSELVFDDFEDSFIANLSVDVLFLALPHGHAHKLGTVLEQFSGKIVDLSADFRLDDVHHYNQVYQQTHQSPKLNESFVLGIPELKRRAIQDAQHIACPGCYSTSVLLALWPFVQHNRPLDKVIIDAKSGMTGAGRSAKVDSLYVERADSFTAYTAGNHRHLAEIEQEIGCSAIMSNYFLPIRRGIVSTCYFDNTYGFDSQSLFEFFSSVYENEPFIEIVDNVSRVSTTHVEGTNMCFLHPVVKNDHIIVFSVIDNLMKGAASQAIQCSKILFGVPETTGLDSLARV